MRNLFQGLAGSRLAQLSQQYTEAHQAWQRHKDKHTLEQKYVALDALAAAGIAPGQLNNPSTAEQTKAAGKLALELDLKRQQQKKTAKHDAARRRFKEKRG